MTMSDLTVEGVLSYASMTWHFYMLCRLCQCELRVCILLCVRACVRACVYVCVCVYPRMCVRACVFVAVCPCLLSELILSTSGTSS